MVCETGDIDFIGFTDGTIPYTCSDNIETVLQNLKLKPLTTPCSQCRQVASLKIGVSPIKKFSFNLDFRIDFLEL